MADTTSSPFARWRSLPLRHVELSDGFWSSRRRVNRDVSLMHGFRMIGEAAHSAEGDYRGRRASRLVLEQLGKPERGPARTEVITPELVVRATA